MHRLALRVRGPILPPISPRGPRGAGAAALAVSAQRRSYASSAPKEAEGPSAQSGGSRSKDAAEKQNKVGNGTSSASDDAALGRTGGGEPLESSRNPPPRPKITNASVPGQGTQKLTKEQQEEVDRHNADFDKKHDRASTAAEDKVDKSFWSGQGGRDGR